MTMTLHEIGEYAVIVLLVIQWGIGVIAVFESAPSYRSLSGVALCGISAVLLVVITFIL